MRPEQTARATAPRAASERPAAIRLDLLGNPYGPSLAVHEALAGTDELHLPAEARAAELRRRLAEAIGVSPEWLLLANGIDELLSMVCLWRRGRGPLLLFPPCDPADERRAGRHRLGVDRVQRAPSFALELDVETAAELDHRSTALVTSPNDPTGTVLATQEAVRLCRACDLLIVDERHGAYGSRSFVPFVREFDNLLVLQTFETWAGLAGLPVALAIGPPRLLRELGEFGRRDGIAMGVALAALATLDDLAYVKATVQLVRQERSRLYRTLRKLNMIEPFPSWANFLLARVTRGEAEVVAAALARREIAVHRPPQPGLERCLRISASRPEHTDALKRALIEIGIAL
jgi:histidinol-phosphate aminotransferase